MKIDRLETHDRLLHFGRQADYISQGCQECINNRPKEYGNHPFYIFAHKRTIGLDEKVAIFNEDVRMSLIDPMYIRKYIDMAEIPEARLIWEPRLTKPKAQSNSMLFRAYPPSDNIKIIWILPAPELWDQYQKEKMTQNEAVCASIDLFLHNRAYLEGPEPDDLPDTVIKSIMCEIGHNARARKNKITAIDGI